MANRFMYKKNAFLIVDPDGELSTGARFLNVDREGKETSRLFYSNSFDKEDEFETAIALNHELTHYIQELTMNACIADGYLTDYIKGYLALASRIPGIEFPLPFDDETKFRKLLSETVSEDDKDTLETLKMLKDIYTSVFMDSFKEENFEKYGSDVPEEEKKYYKISFKDLVESHAYHKAYWDYYGRNQDATDSCQMLHSLAMKNDLYPYVFENGKLETDGFKSNIFYRSMYMLPYYLQLRAFPMDRVKSDYVNYCNLQIPYRYSDSVGNWFHSLSLLITETALGIPGVEYIIKQVQEGCDKRQFSPGYRFFKILDTIHKDPNFLFESVDGEDFCITFFNHIAKDNGWLSYEETAKTMYYSIHQRTEYNHEVIAHYQQNLWVEKQKDLKHFVHRIPIEIINKFVLPILIQQKWGINIEIHLDHSIFDESTRTDFYTEYFKSQINKYQFIEGTTKNDELLSKIHHNCHGAIREIINRLFAADAREAHTKSKEYHCPLANGGCQNYCEQCSSFKSFNNVTMYCSNKILRMGNSKRYLEDGGGNTPDCMYFNYMLDNGFEECNLNFK